MARNAFVGRDRAGKEIDRARAVAGRAGQAGNAGAGLAAFHRRLMGMMIVALQRMIAGRMAVHAAAGGEHFRRLGEERARPRRLIVHAGKGSGRPQLLGPRCRNAEREGHQARCYQRSSRVPHARLFAAHQRTSVENVRARNSCARRSPCQKNRPGLARGRGSGPPHGGLADHRQPGARSEVPAISKKIARVPTRRTNLQNPRGVAISRPPSIRSEAAPEPAGHSGQGEIEPL
jgi:hypothetical protein